MALLADAALPAEDEPAELEAAIGGPLAASASVAGREEVRQQQQSGAAERDSAAAATDPIATAEAEVSRLVAEFMGVPAATNQVTLPVLKQFIQERLCPSYRAGSKKRAQVRYDLLQLARKRGPLHSPVLAPTQPQPAAQPQDQPVAPPCPLPAADIAAWLDQVFPPSSRAMPCPRSAISSLCSSPLANSPARAALRAQPSPTLRRPQLRRLT